MRQVFGSDVDATEISLEAARLLLRQSQQRKLLGGIATRLKDAKFTDVEMPGSVGPPRRVLRIRGEIYMRGTGCYTTPWQERTFEALVHGKRAQGHSDDVREWESGSDIEIIIDNDTRLKATFQISRHGKLTVAPHG